MTALNYADKIYIGGQQASAAYVGSTRVWPTFKPTDIAGCVIWLDASKLNLANGAAVNAWKNLGSGPQPTIVNTPAPTLRANALNGLPVVRITIDQGCLRFTGTGITQDWTVIYVARRWRNTIGRIITAMAGTNQNVLIGFWNQYMDVAYMEGWHIDPGVSGSGGSATTWKMYSADSATPAATPRLFSNGVLFNTFPTPPSTSTWAGTFNISGSGPTEYADCEIAEVVQYNRKLSDAERQQVEGYLRTKWSPPAFSLTDLGASLVGWFDGADASTVQIVGSGVNNWRNKGVGALTLNQTNDAYRPRYANQTVNFTTPQQLVPANSPQTYDLVMLGRPQHVSLGEWRTLLRGTTSSHQVIIETGSTRLGTYNAGFFQAGALTWDNVWGLLYGNFGSGAVALALNGGVATSTGTTLTVADVPFISFGAYQGPPPTQGFGDIKEFVLLPYGSGAIKALVEGYLAHKWGYAGLLPASHIYKATPP